MTEPLDTGDVDALDELLGSPGWKLVCERIAVQLVRDQNALQVPGTPDRVSEGLRGSIARARMMLKLPKAMREELKAGLKK